MNTYPPASPVQSSVDDVNIRSIAELMRPVDLQEELPVTRSITAFVAATRASIARVLSGEDPRILVVVGPCSVHDVAAALEYARWIRACEWMGNQLLVVMRVYFEKPRTRGGWKGLINDPYLDGTFRINKGFRLARKLLLDINALGVPAATEFVDPITPQYLGDLVSWAAIGARTTESQVHRELASGLSCPVGFKNGTSGDLAIAVNAVVAARRPQRFLGVTKWGRAAIVETAGNRNCHVILRGGVDPNYDESSVAAAAALLAAEGLPAQLMVDCSHANCQGDYRRQLVVGQEVVRQRRSGSRLVCGVMIESNLIGGKQPLVPGHTPLPGVSITDPCLCIEETETLLASLVQTETSVVPA